MNRGEVRLPDVSRMRQNTLVNLVDVLLDQFVRYPEGDYRFRQRTPGWCLRWCWCRGHHHSYCPRSSVLRKDRAERITYSGLALPLSNRATNHFTAGHDRRKRDG